MIHSDPILEFPAPTWDDPDPPFNSSFPYPQEVQWPAPMCDNLRYWTEGQNSCYPRTQVPSILCIRGWRPSQSVEPPWRPQMTAPLPNEQDYLWLRSRSIPVDFPRFCDLPVNVRTMIWAHAIVNDPRVFEMRHPGLYLYDQNRTLVQRPRYLVKPRALASVCSESRLQFVKVHLGAHENYLMNFNADFIYFGPDSYWRNDTPCRPSREKATQCGISVGDYESEEDWEPRQLWNHWRYGYDNSGNGKETIYDQDRKRNVTRYSQDPYHPLLSASKYEFERLEIKNVAFDLEFWNEIEERRTNGQRDLLSKFPSARRFVLASGDTGASLHLTRVDKGPNFNMGVTYSPSLKQNRIDRHPGFVYKGQVEFHSGAVQTPLAQNVLDMTVARSGAYPTPVTMCITRGRKYRGHLSRWVNNQLPRSLRDKDYGDDDDDDDMDDFDDDDPLAWALLDIRHKKEEIMNAKQEDRDKRDDLMDVGKIPGRRELSDLLHGRDNPWSMWELEEQRDELNKEFRGIGPVEAFQAFEAFHATAPVPPDEDTEEEVSEDEDVEDEDVDDKDNSPEIDKDTTIVDNLYAGDASFATARPKVAAQKNAMAVKVDNNVETNDMKVGKTHAKKVVKAAKKKAPKVKGQFARKALELPCEGEKVATIRESALHYGKLTYRVTWIDENGKHRPDKQRWPHDHQLLDNDHCRARIATFHEAHPNALNLEDEEGYERKPYGTSKKYEVEEAGRSASAPQEDEVNNMVDVDQSIENSSRSASTPQQDKANVKTDLNHSFEIDSRLSTPLSTPPSYPSQSSTEQREEFHHSMEDQANEDTIDNPHSASTSWNYQDSYNASEDERVVKKPRFAPTMGAKMPPTCPTRRM